MPWSTSAGSPRACPYAPSQRRMGGNKWAAPLPAVSCACREGCRPPGPPLLLRGGYRPPGSPDWRLR
eukprot:5015139-Alexandrium_andersonii.AAC.1